MQAGLRLRGLIAVGFDLGGTWVRALAVGSDGTRLRSLRSKAPDLARLPESLRKLWRRWRVTPGQVAALVVATRGVWTASERRLQEKRLSNLALKVRVLSDAEAAYLGALGDAPGLLVLAGTGSIVLGRNSRGRWVRRGGFGPLLGDEGSAFWIGREWLRATSRGGDFAPVRAIVGRPDAVSRIAALAPRVLKNARRGHPIARRIIAEAQRHLAGLARALARELRLEEPVAVSWAGSLLDDQQFRSGLHQQLKKSGLSVRMVSPEASPVMAAARMALDLLRHG